MTTITPQATSVDVLAHPSTTHQHTARCYWDLTCCRWRCAGMRPDARESDGGPPLPRLLRPFAELLSTPERSVVRVGAVAGADDGC